MASTAQLHRFKASNVFLDYSQTFIGKLNYFERNKNRYTMVLDNVFHTLLCAFHENYLKYFSNKLGVWPCTWKLSTIEFLVDVTSLVHKNFIRLTWDRLKMNSSFTKKPGQTTECNLIENTLKTYDLRGKELKG